jgi:hypothetical protein
MRDPLGGYMRSITWWLLRYSAVLLALACGDEKHTGQLQHSTRLYPQDYAWIFDSIQTHGWGRESVLVWSYFFVDPDSATLRGLANRLESDGYRVADLWPDSTQSAYWVQLEKIEKHTLTSLAARNDSLYFLADSMHVFSYDGMDVGPLRDGKVRVR